jgi:4-alpha-glucanotransferase
MSRATPPSLLAERSAGLLLHPTSLAGPPGNGDLGAAAHRFADFLAEAGQRWWQMLPVHPPGDGWSPYHGLSAFAGSPLLIALEPLVQAGWLKPEEHTPPARPQGSRARFDASLRYREPRLRLAFSRFEAGATPAARAALERFRAGQADWLEDYALFMALKVRQGGASWWEWPAPLRRRQPAALCRAREELAGEIRYRRFSQFLFDRQWRALREHCRARGVALLGDVPIFVAPDSADVWAHRELFYVDRDGRLPVVAGVPPDAFSATGQRWGNPLYRWAVHRRGGYRWWIERLRATLGRFDATRLDHFIGFVRYWEVPSREQTALRGRFLPGPGADFFERLRSGLGGLPLIAEDLGLVTAEVTALREQFELPGMRVLQFAFGENEPNNPHLPHQHPRACVVYTGTHDNDTLVGWARGPGGRLRPEARRALAYLGRKVRGGEPVHWALIRLAYLSPASLAVLPVQDPLGLGRRARMNLPGTPSGNWRWRLGEDALTPALAERLRSLSLQYGRAAASPFASPNPREPRP